MISKLKLIPILILFLIAPSIAGADVIGQSVKFYIDPSYDLKKREEITATLRIITSQLYFYIDDIWWNSLDYNQQQKINSLLADLAKEFKTEIYPTLTTHFGSEWKPGIDKDERITILIHSMIEESGGYFNNGDEYPKIQNPKSNQREMIYLNSSFVDKPIAKSLLAHEFLHLITFNQKEKTYGVSEEIWLNEARAEYAVTLLGYDDIYQGSNLEKRVKIFLEKSSDSLTEWKGKKEDYGVVNLFIQYLIDHYGREILANSLFLKKIGIPSLDEALEKRGFKENFSQIFTNWSITVFLNDCPLGQKYCYKNPNLKNLKVIPQLNFLPLIGESSLQFTNANYDWSANWYKIVGGKGKLILEFDGQDEGKFKVSYLLCDFQERCQIEILSLNEKQEGKIIVPEFSKNYQSLIIIPTIQTKVLGFDGMQPTYLFSWKVSAVEKTEEEKEAELKKQLLAQINFLQEEIARIQAEINKILAKKLPTSQTEIGIPAGFSFEKNLSFGINDPDVVYLKIILEKEVSHLTWSGNDYFGTKTLAAVKAFQEKYKAEISQFAGYPISATGFVGKGTRTKLNQILQKY